MISVHANISEEITPIHSLTSLLLIKHLVPHVNVLKPALWCVQSVYVFSVSRMMDILTAVIRVQTEPILFHVSV